MNATLVLLKKDGSQKAFALPSNVTVVGRRHDCDLQIPLPTVSRRHCQIHAANGVLRIRDLGSRWGTFLNGKRIDEETEAQAGDWIRIGPLTFGIQIDGQPARIEPPPAEPKPQPGPAAKGKEPAAESDDDDIFGDIDGDDEFIDLDDDDLEELDI